MTVFPELQPYTQRGVLGLLAIVLLGVALRVPGLTAHSYWYDEAITQQLIRHSYGELATGNARDNGNPPLYWLAARGWQQLVGVGDARLRALSMVCGGLTIAALGFLGRRLAGVAVGLGAAAVYAVSPLAVEFANEARVYALLHLLAVVNALFFVRALSTHRVFDWVGYSATMFLTWYSHYYSAFLPLAHLLVLIMLPASRRQWVSWGIALLAAGIIGSTWLPAFHTQLMTPGNLTRSADNWVVQFFATPVSYAFGRSLAWRESPKWLLGIAGLGTVVAFLIPAVLGIARLWKWKPAAVLLVGWLLLPILIPLALAVLGKPLYSHRYAAIGLPAFAVLVTAGYAALQSRWRWALVTVAVALTTISLYRHATEPLKDDWRAATPVIQNSLDTNRLLVFDTMIEVETFQHYAGENQPRDAVGLDTTPADGVALRGVRYRDGQRLDRVARDYAPEIFEADRVCLILCVPGRTEDYYETTFRERGFVISRSESFHRIRVLYLDRVTTLR